MELHKEVDAARLLKAQTHVWNHIFSFVNSMSLKCAIDLGIPDIIHNHGKPMPLSQLVSALPIHPSKTDCIYRLMRILIFSGFFAQTKVADNELEEGYILTDASKLLVKDNPLGLTPFLLGVLDPVLIKPWLKLTTWFQNEDPMPFTTEHGMTIWEYAGNEPNFNNIFNDAMASDSRFVNSSVIEKCKGVFKDLESLVDVGGGIGTLAKAIAKEFPQVECTVFDLPHVIEGLQGSGNLKFVAGDMFETIPPADAIIFKWILHNWSDEDCIKLLKKCKEALANKGKERKVIIIDMVMENEKEDDESVKTQLFLDMVMMVLFRGKERNEKEWAKLIFSAGFSDYKINPVLGLNSLIEAYP